jgi:predicted RNA-binding Zn-ribbon protein involved in translation (DUF1610 family)
MIVRCTNCNSAFAVDDGKVENKKFAFTCPKCDEENIIDNRSGRKISMGAPVTDSRARPDFMKTPEAASKERKETFAGKGNDFGEETDLGHEISPPIAAKTDLPDDLFLDDSVLTDEIPRKERRDALHETETSIGTSELPPADDLNFDIPLDDIVERETAPGSKHAGSMPQKEAGEETVFEEHGEAGIFKPDGELILDELEPLPEKEESKKSFELDLDEPLLRDEKAIIDDFGPLEEPSGAVSLDEQNGVLEGEIKAEEVFHKDHTKKEDESITIDLNSLDIDLEDDDGNAVDKSSIDMQEPLAGAGFEPAVAAGPALDEDENITIDLDSLDIDLSEEEKVSKGESHDELDLDISDFSEETIKELEDKPQIQDDEDITLDLESLDISLEESSEIKEGEVPEDDEKLTLEDAGLMLEDLTTDELSSVSLGVEAAPDEEPSLIHDDLDSSFDIKTIEKELEEAEIILSETPEAREGARMEEFKDLPEIDFGNDMKIMESYSAPDSMKTSNTVDELIAISDNEKLTDIKGGLQKGAPDVVPRGAVNFSIDYSIRYSRIGDLLRIPGIFLIGMIPHFITFFIYFVLSIILSFLNLLIIIFTARSVEDFSEIQVNTLRYFLSINASLFGIVEEMPVFAGKENIDYPLQMRITLPLRYSRILAVLRLSVIGIILASVPHLLILGLLSPVVFIIYATGLFSVLIMGRWPHFLFEFMARYYRYIAKVLAFSVGIVDAYPTFRFV